MILINFNNIKVLSSAESFLYKIKEKMDDDVIIFPHILDTKDFKNKFNYKTGVTITNGLDISTIKNLEIRFALINTELSRCGFNQTFEIIKQCLDYNIRSFIYSYSPEEFLKLKSLDGEYSIIKLNELKDILKYSIGINDKVVVDYNIRSYKDIDYLTKIGINNFIIKPYIKDFNLLKNYYD